MKRLLEGSPCAGVDTPPLGSRDGHDSEGQGGKRQWGGSGAGTAYARSAVLRQHLEGSPAGGAAPPGHRGGHDLEWLGEERQGYGSGSGAARARSTLLRRRLEGSPCAGPATPPKRARWGRAADDDAAAYTSTTAGTATVANATLLKQVRWGRAAGSEAAGLPGASAGVTTITPVALVARTGYRTSIAVATAAWPPIAASAATAAAVAAGGTTGAAAAVAAAPAPATTQPGQPVQLQGHTGSSSLVRLLGQEQATPLQRSTKHGVVSSKPSAHQPDQPLCLYSGGATSPVVLPGQHQVLPTDGPASRWIPKQAGQPLPMLDGRGSGSLQKQTDGQPMHLAPGGRDSRSSPQQAGQPPHLHREGRGSETSQQQTGQLPHSNGGGRDSGSFQKQAPHPHREGRGSGNPQQQVCQPPHSHREGGWAGNQGIVHRYQGGRGQKAPEVTCRLWGDCVNAEDVWNGRTAPVRTYPWLK